MSSSLDDLEPYEIFQNELDEYLKEYKADLADIANASGHLFLINTFIEYICFVQSKGAFEEITAEEINLDFLNFVKSKFEKEISSTDVLYPVYSYLKYINKKHGKPHKGFLNHLIS